MSELNNLLKKADLNRPMKIREVFKAFTIAELIVVVAILAILSTIGFLALSGYTQDAKESATKAGVRSVYALISAESTAQQISARNFVIHDPALALSGAFVYVDGYPTVLTGGNFDDPSTPDANYTSGAPNWTKLKLNPDKFRFSQKDRWPVVGGLVSEGHETAHAEVAAPWNSVVIGAAELTELRNGKLRGVSLYQTVGIVPNTGKAEIMGYFPSPTPSDVVNAQGMDKAAATGLIRNPSASASQGIVEGDAVSVPGGNAAIQTDCALPWGGTLGNGQSVTAYRQSYAVSTCESQTRTCTNGTLSGTYTSQGCVVGCAPGFTLSPGNATFSATPFCIAKYEMKFVDTSGKNQNPAPWNTWQWGGGGSIVSVPEGLPIASITQKQAIDACASLGDGYHLVTNDEWMTIARNIESVSANWTSGTVGNGGIYRGNTGVASTLSCDAVGTDHCTFAESDTVGLASTRTLCKDMRQLKLSNGSVIWDFAGNIWEHVNGANTYDGSSHDTLNGRTCGTTDGWFSFYNNDGYAACTFNSPMYTYAKIGPATANMNINNGVGRVYSYNSASNDRIMARGSTGHNGAQTGIYATTLAWSGTSSEQHLGFRCAMK